MIIVIRIRCRALIEWALRWVLIDEKTNNVGKCNSILNVDLPFRLVARGPKLQRQRTWRLNWMSVCESDKRTRLPPKGIKTREKKLTEKSVRDRNEKKKFNPDFFFCLSFFYFLFLSGAQIERKWRKVKRKRQKCYEFSNFVRIINDGNQTEMQI